NPSGVVPDSSIRVKDLSTQRLDSPQIAHSIDSFESNYVSPLFPHFIFSPFQLTALLLEKSRLGRSPGQSPSRVQSQQAPSGPPSDLLSVMIPALSRIWQYFSGVFLCLCSHPLLPSQRPLFIHC